MRFCSKSHAFLILPPGFIFFPLPKTLLHTCQIIPDCHSIILNTIIPVIQSSESIQLLFEKEMDVYDNPINQRY